MKWIVTCTALVIASAAVSSDALEESDDARSVGVDIGRLGVINDHTCGPPFVP